LLTVRLTPAFLAGTEACFFVGDSFGTRPDDLVGRFSRCGVSARGGAFEAAMMSRVASLPLHWFVALAESNDPTNPTLAFVFL